MRTNRSWIGRSRTAVLLLVVALLAAACTGSASLTETGAQPQSTPGERSTVDAVEPTAVPAEPTSELVEPTEVPVVDPTPASVEPAVDLPFLPSESFRTDNVVGIAPGGRHGYAGTTSPWNSPTACDDPPAESLAVIDLEMANGADVMPYAAGLEQAGDIRQMVVGPGSSLAILSSCGDPDVSQTWLRRVEIGDDGRIVSAGEVLPMSDESTRDPYLRRWVDDDSVEIDVGVDSDSDDPEDWFFERQTVSLATGEVIASQRFEFFDDSAYAGQSELTTADGFTYRTIEDPDGAFGCEGAGVARTIELDNGDNTTLALTQPGLVFSDVTDLHTSATGHIAWTSGCEGFVSAYVGKLLPSGQIADAHLIDLYTQPFESYAEYQTYRLTDDGYLVAIGQSFDPQVEAGTLSILRYDLNADPNFVNTADPMPLIEPDPLLVAVGGEGGWHVGETLATDSACGDSTLYGQTPGGFLRAFPAGIEIDSIVAMHAAETRVIEYEDGGSYTSRTVVALTECPAGYEGRRVWFGIESDQIVWGLSLSQADVGEVAAVLSVRDILDGQFVETSVVEVELLDGTIAEIELSPLPFDG